MATTREIFEKVEKKIKERSSELSDVRACTIKAKDVHFVDMFTGKLRPESALLTGKIKMSGDIGLAMKLGQILRK